MKKDIEFLKEMQSITTELLYEKYDITKLQHLDKMISDWKDELEQNSHKHSVSGKQPDYKTIRAAAFKYQKDTCIAPDCDTQMKSYCMADFIAGAQWALSQVACANAEAREGKE